MRLRFYQDFETFIRYLVSDEEYDTSEEDKEEDLRKVAVY